MATKTGKIRRHPFQRAVLRGIAVILPPLLTIVFLLWIWNSIQTYVLNPIEGMTQRMLVHRVAEIHEVPPVGRDQILVDQNGNRSFNQDGETFVELPSGQWIPSLVADTVRRARARSPGTAMPMTAEAFYDRYVAIRWLRPSLVLPVALSVFIIFVYLLGKFIAARVGRMVFSYVDRLINQLPFVRTVYGTFKQVTDLAFNEQEIEFSRAVAIEYPRQGLWSVGFVTGESMLQLKDAAGGSVISVLMPTSPAPFTGFTVTVRKSEAIDLDITRDQAFQFVVSCGVVVPQNQQTDVIKATIEAMVSNPPEPSDVGSSLPPAVPSSDSTG